SIPAAIGVSIAGCGADPIEPDLVRSQSQEHAGVIGVRAIVSPDPFDPEFGAQTPRRKLPAGRRIGVVHQQAKFVSPAPRCAERAELMLPEDMRRETVRISGSPQLGVSKKIDLAMSLFERLHDPQFFDPAPPRDDVVDAVAGRMP